VSKAPSMPMYWDAYLADTTHLTTEEHGAYLLLLAAMWRRNGSVPDNDKDNARILGLTVAKWKRTKERLSQFLIIKDGDISQGKLLEIWENTQEKITKNRENGAKGGRAVSNKNNDLAQANASNSLNPNASIPEPEPEPYNPPVPTVQSPQGGRVPKRATRLPEDWQPNDRLRLYAASKGLTENEINAERDNIVDWSRSSQKGAKHDWHATWRSWVRRCAKEIGDGKRSGRNGTKHGSAVAAANRSIHRSGREHGVTGNTVGDVWGSSEIGSDGSGGGDGGGDGPARIGHDVGQGASGTSDGDGIKSGSGRRPGLSERDSESGIEGLSSRCGDGGDTGSGQTIDVHAEPE